MAVGAELVKPAVNQRFSMRTHASARARAGFGRAALGKNKAGLMLRLLAFSFAMQKVPNT